MVELGPIVQYGSFGALILFAVLAARWFVKRDEKEQVTRAEERAAQQEQISKDRQFLHDLLKSSQEQYDKHLASLQKVTEAAISHMNQSNNVLAELQLSLVDHRHEFQVHDRETREGLQRLQPVERGT